MRRNASFADLLHYLGERSDRIALLRSREEALGAIESPSERSARITLLADLADARAANRPLRRSPRCAST